MRTVQSYKHYIYARCNPGQVGRWNLIAARGMLKPVYFAFVKTMLEFLFANYTFFVKSRAHSPSPTSKIIAIMIALRRAILMKADPVVSFHAHHLFSGRAGSCKKDPCFCQHARSCERSQSEHRSQFRARGISHSMRWRSHNWYWLTFPLFVFRY